jgi:hypothetical protein
MFSPLIAVNILQEPTFWALVGVAGGLYLFLRGFKILQRKRLLENTPESKIRSASMGLVEISGQAVGPYTIPAPACGFDCFYYRTIAWELKQSGKNKEWVKVAEESLHLPFFLDDGTGRLLVDCNGAETDLHRDFHEQYRHSLFSADDPVPDGIRSFLARHGVSSEHELKVDEYCIKPKNFLFVLGTLSENPGLELTPMPRRTAPPHTLTLNLPGGSPGHSTTLTVSLQNPLQPALEVRQPEPIALPAPVNAGTTQNTAGLDEMNVVDALIKAGISSPRAWAAAGIGNPAAARALVAHGPMTNVAPRASEPFAPRSTQAAAPYDFPKMGPAATAAAPAPALASPPQADTAFDPHPKTVLMRGENDASFLISWRSQKEVVSELGWKSAFYIWGGPLLLLLSAYVLLQQFGRL